MKDALIAASLFLYFYRVEALLIGLFGVGLVLLGLGRLVMAR